MINKEVEVETVGKPVRAKARATVIGGMDTKEGQAADTHGRAIKIAKAGTHVTAENQRVDSSARTAGTCPKTKKRHRRGWDLNVLPLKKLAPLGVLWVPRVRQRETKQLDHLRGFVRPFHEAWGARVDPYSH